jgi:hypothetical protein
MVTTQLPVPVQPPPAQPVKRDPEAAEAERVTIVPSSYSELHVEPQSIPATSEETDPDPEPSFATVSVYSAAKVAVTLLAAFIVTTHVPVPEQPAPDQPVKREPELAFAATVTTAPSSNSPLQVEPQLIPPTSEETDPDPEPPFATISV